MAGKKARNNSNHKVRNTILIVLTIFFSAVIIVSASVVGVVYHYIGLIKWVDPNDTADNIDPSMEDFDTDEELGNMGDSVTDENGIAVTQPPEIHPDDVEWGDINNLTQFEDDGLINIMLVGQDRREGESRQRSDSMILVSVNPKTKGVSVISFLRDTYVQIPGNYSDNRLNVAYKFGGFKLLKETLKLNFGVTIDGCFECDFNDFKEIIDILGGVEIDLTKKEASYMSDKLGKKISSGKRTLNGREALVYARIRVIDSDFKRTERQRTILMTLFKKFKNAGVMELKSIADEILPKLATDMESGQIASLMVEILPMVSSMDPKTYSVPFEGAYRNASIRKMSVLVPDLEVIRKKLANEYLPFER